MSQPFFANFDLASLAIWMFWLFFAGLVFYIQRENMREGYPLEDEDNPERTKAPLFGVPEDKTFILPHGRGERSLPSDQNGERQNLGLAKTDGGTGFPYMPTGNPLLDGVGPASWASRRDVPELDAKGHPKIRPLSKLEAFHVSAGRDPHGLPVIAGDGQTVGTVSDLWIDEPEQLVRYLTIELTAGGHCLVPMAMARITRKGVKVVSIFGAHFADVPKTARDDQITLLEEEKISAYYGGGYLYASAERSEPIV